MWMAVVTGPSPGEAADMRAMVRRRVRSSRIVRPGVLAVTGMLAALAVACGGGQGEGVREVLVDYQDDEVASSFLLYFPSNVTVHPGDEVVFRQEWTGEPHSVTMGTLVDDMMGVVRPLMDQWLEVPEDEVPPEVFEQFEAAMAPLPWMMGDEGTVQQNGAQPCYLDEGGPPEDPATPCSDEQQEQPAFDGRQSYYNSGYIHYEGPQGNEFRVPLAEDIEPGVYNYYCNLHSPSMGGTITVAEPDEEIPSQEDVARQARAEIEEVAQPLREAFAELTETSDGEAEVEGRSVPKPLAGFYEQSIGHAIISEFIPRRIEIPAGDAVTWHFVGPHTVSFDVPEYFAQITVADDGTVEFNPQAIEPVNSPGAPEEEGPPEGEEGGEGGAAPSPEEAAPPEEGVPPDEEETVVVDAGEWHGEGFISSGMFFSHAYRLTFTQPGTYPYACLIHPQMVGEVVVR